MDKSDEYAYLERPGFSGEKFKIEIRGLPKYYGISEFKKLVNKKLELNLTKLKVPKPGSHYLFICFKDDVDRDAALTKLNGFSWKGKTLSASPAKPTPDPLVKRRNEDSDDTNPKRIKKTLAETTTDLAHLSYPDQLKHKQNEMIDVLKKFGNDVWTGIPSMRLYIEEQRKLHNGLPCELLSIKHTAHIDGYRNKCEFTIGKNEKGERVVGFRLGSYSIGSVEVESPDSLKNISERMKKTAKLFESFVRKSDLDVYNNELQIGNFRQLTVRTTRATDELMIVVGIYEDDLTKEKLRSFRRELLEFFTEGDGKQLGVTSLFYQSIPKKKTDTVPEVVHIYGSRYLTEVILGLRFRISPYAFFQVNTSSAEVLYQTVIDFAAPKSTSTILDICCGTGTIGLCFSKYAKQIIGCEINAEAIEDAKCNTSENGIENCLFIAGSAEELIDSMAMRAKQANSESIAIVDPPRAGLHNTAINSIRSVSNLNRLVYVSCAPKGATKNWFDLMRPNSKTMKRNPFKPVKAVAVDMFPHTHHTELIILFERMSDAEIEKYDNVEHSNGKCDKSIDDEPSHLIESKDKETVAEPEVNEPTTENEASIAVESEKELNDKSCIEKSNDEDSNIHNVLTTDTKMTEVDTKAPAESIKEQKTEATP